MQSFPSYGIYQAIGLLGRGGMGSVYLAERNDGVFSQQVAVKVLSQHLATDDFEARFIVERQLLAQMQHPNIVRLLDGGITSSGEPYLVTEYVDGISIDEFCDHRRLPIRDRIRVFLEVCAAVEHAHQNLIVHRDLKPSNILVSRKDGHAKLLDFGTAKLIKGRDEATVTEVMLLTPRYASPEQLRKDPITTRSDVYSLGMVLYELLSGQRPFGESSDMMQELARAYQYTEGRALGKTVTGENAARRGISERDLQRTLSGDLAVICAKALDHEPARRYSNARELAGDLESWLASRPVSARPATAAYRASKFLRRNWPLATAALLILIAAFSGVVGTLREKRLAERRFDDVRRLAHYQIFDLYDQMLEVDGTTKIRAGMSAEALRYLDALAAEANQDESLAVELALGYQRVGDVTGNYSTQSLGNWKEAAQLYEKGLAVLAPFQSPSAKRTRAMLNRGYTVARSALDPQPQFQATLEGLVKDFEAALVEDPRNAENYLNLGNAYASVARAVQRQRNATGLLDRGTDLLRRARDTFEKGLKQDPNSKHLLIALHKVSSEPANWLAQTKPEEALQWSNEAEVWRLRIPEPTRNSMAVKRDWASNLSSRSSALFSLGEREQGRTEMLHALEVFESLATDPDNLTAKNDLYTVLHNLSLLEDELNHAKEYLVISERMLVLAEELLLLSPAPRMNFYLQNALGNLCYAYSTAKDPRADATLARTFAILEQKAKDQPNDTASRVTMADLLLNLAHPGYDQADKALTYSTEIAALIPEEFNGWDLMSMAHFKLKHYPEAVAALEKSISRIPAPKPGQTPSALYVKLNERLARYRAKLATAARQ